MRSARLVGWNPAEAKRALRISAAASRIHSRFGCPVRLSNGSTSRTRDPTAPDSVPSPEASGLACPHTQTEASNAQKNVIAAPAPIRRTHRKRIAF
jgi:hypothetical protein